MRWAFADGSDARERKEREAVVGKIEAWWREFAGRTEDLDAMFNNRKQWDLPGWMERQLQGIDERLMWEYGHAVKGEGHRLVITPEGEKQLRPLVGEILRRAPKMPGWEFYAYRLAETVEVADLTVKARANGSLEGVTARAAIGEHHLVDLVYQSPRCTGPEDQQALSEALVAAETLLGEEVLDKWVGAIEVEAAAKGGVLGKLFGKKAPRAGVGLERLGPTVSALVESIREQLPDRPQYQIDLKGEDHPWGSYSREPEDREDYGGREDLIAGSTGYIDMVVAAHSGRAFCSERFSRFGETFCYLKIDGAGADKGMRFGDREEIEEAIDAVIVPEAVGCVIGGGTGKRYTYVDLALTDVRRAVELMRPALRKGRIPARTWLMFFDDELVEEWMGIGEGGGAPPKMSAGE
jgi:hypothetical protein